MKRIVHNWLSYCKTRGYVKPNIKTNIRFIISQQTSSITVIV